MNKREARYFLSGMAIGLFEPDPTAAQHFWLKVCHEYGFATADFEETSKEIQELERRIREEAA
jgi:hypothetical protein